MAKYLEKELLSQAEIISNFGVWELDINSNDFYWSDGVFIICGYEPQEFEVTFEKNLSVIHPDDREFTIAQVQNTIATGKEFDVRKRFITKSGDIKYINSKGKLIKDDQGKALKLRGVFQDITHTIELETTLKNTVKDLKARNEFIETILQNLPIGIAVNKIDTGEATIVNKQFAASYGWSDDDLTDINSFFKKVYPDETYRNEMVSKILADIKSGNPERMNWSGIKVTSSTGAQKIIDAKNIPLFEQNLMISTVVDVTEKAHLYHQNIAQEADLKALIENTPDIIYSIDMDFKLLTYNSAFENVIKHLGLGKVAKGLNVFDFYSDEKRELYSAVFLIVKQGKRYTFEDELFVNGQSIFYEVSVNPILNEENAVIGVSIFSKDVTEKIKKEKELERIKINQESIINGTSDIIWSINNDFELITANTAFYESIKAFIGHNIKPGDSLIFQPGGENEGLFNIWIDLFQRSLNGESFTFDYFDEFQGYPNYSLISFSPMLNDKQEVWGVACYSKNVTKEKLSFLELEKAKEDLQKIMDSSLDVICTFNKDSEFVKVNAASERVWGYKPEELIGKNYNFLVHPDDLNRTDTTTEEIHDGVNALNFENRNIKKDGTIIYMMWSATYDEKEELTYCIAKNVTQNKKTQEKLRLSEQYFKNLIQNGGDLVGILSTEGDYVYVSPNSHAILGIPSEELIGKNCFNFMHSDDKDNIEQDFIKLATSKRVQFEPFRFKHNNGSWLWLEAIGTNLLDDTAINGIVINARDITDKVNRDNVLENTNKTLKNAQKLGKIGNYEFNLITNEVFCSDEIYSIYEIDKYLDPITTPQDFLNLTHPDDLDNLIQHRDKIIETGEVSSILYRIITKKNTLKYVRQVVELIYVEETKSNWLYGTVRDSTPNVLAQQDLEISEKKYKNLFDNNPSVMLLFDFETLKIIDCNQEAVELYGYTKEEFLNLTIRDIRPAEDIDLINKATENEEAYGQVHKDLWRHQKKSGEVIFVNVNGHLIDYEDKRCSLVSVTDITEKLEAEKAIKESEQQRELIMNAALDAIICIDKKGDVQFWNPQAEKIFDWKSNEVIGKNLTQLIVPHQYRSAHDNGMNHYLKTKEGPVLNKLLELSAINKAGKEFPIELTVIPISEGENEFFCSFIRDISVRKTIEFELKQSEERYKLLFQNSPLPKWIYDLKEFRFVDVNETAIKHYGYTREEFLSMTLKDVRPKEDIPKLLEIQKSIKNRDGVINFGIFNHQKKDKTVIKVEVAGQKITYLGKDCMMVLCNDVTERELAFEQLKQNEIKLLTAQKIAKIGYWQLNIDKKELYWSDEVYEIWEQEKDSFTPSFDSFFSTIHPDEQFNLLNHQNAALANNSNLDFVHSIILPNGGIKWVHEKGELVLNDDGKAISLNGTVQDITKEKSLELSLIASNQRYEYVTKATFDAIWDWDLTTDLIYWGESFTTIFGYKKSEIEPDISSWSKRIHPDDYERVIKGAHLIIHSETFEENWNDEYRFLKADGTYAFVQDKGVVIRNEKHEATRMVGAIQDITKKKEENLRLKLLESVVTNTNDAILITEAEPFDEPGPRILYANDAFSKMTGYTSDEVIGKTPRILQGPKTDKKEIKRLSKALRNWESCEITTINYKKNGEEFYINLSINPVIDSKGWFTHWIAIERDVTESVLAQQKLKSSLDERNTILESIDDGFFAIDSNSLVTYWNKKAEELLGEKRESVIGKNLHEMFANPDSMAFHDHYQLAIKENKTIHFEEFSNRSKKWFEVSAFASDKGLSVYFKDTTDKKAKEEEIKAERNLLRTLIDNLPDTIYIKDAAARKVISNKIDYNLIGFEHEEDVIGKTDLELFNDDLGKIGHYHDLEIIKTGMELINFEQNFTKKDGNPLWLLTTKVPLKNNENKIVGILGIGRDITEIKLAQENIKNVNIELEKNVNQLQISNKELEQFAYVASHDLQEPLRMITSFLTQIEKKYNDVLDEKGKQYIHFAVDGAKRMRQIILDLLEFSRIGRLSENLEDVDVHELIKEIQSLYRKQITEVSAKLEFGDFPKVLSHKTPIRQVLQNLISNALKYHNPKNLTLIKIDVTENDKFWQFSVKDNGIGIEEEYYQKIFIIFQRLHNKDEYSGTGMGLAICKKIVESLGGKIWVKANADEGSCFYFTIPK